jgi:triphosphoribosyl-dephospho-CoA synthase
MTLEIAGSAGSSSFGQGLRPGQMAQAACMLEVTARKPGNVHRYADLPGLHFVDFLWSAMAIAEPLDQAGPTGVGRAVLAAIEATRWVVSTNTNLGIVLLLAPLAAVPKTVDLAEGIEDVLAATTVDDSRHAYRAIRLAQPGGLGEVSDQDVAREPTIPLRAVMATAAERDLIARQYANGFREVLDEALPALRKPLNAGSPLESAIVSSYLTVLARHPDSLITRKYGLAHANEVSRRAAELLDAGWPECEHACDRLGAFDSWLRQPSNRFNPGTTADLVTAALYAALRDGTIKCPLPYEA